MYIAYTASQYISLLHVSAQVVL